MTNSIFYTLIFLIIMAFLLFMPEVASAGPDEEDVSVTEVSVYQNGKELRVENGEVLDHVDSLLEVEIHPTVINSGKQNLTLFVDVSPVKDGGLWENILKMDIGSPDTQSIPSIPLLLNETNPECLRIRVSLNSSEYSPVIDSNLTNNHVVLKFKDITPGEAEARKSFRWFHALIALIPLAVVFVGILIFKLSSRYVAPAALIITLILALIFFRGQMGWDDALRKMGSTIAYSALWGGLDYVYAIFGAFFFLKMLEKVGAIDQLKNDFKSISSDKQHQVLLIGFCFALVLATVAPAGSNFVIAAIMLVSLGFNRVGVGVLCLFGNSISSVFGLLGVSIIALNEVTNLEILALSGWIGIYMIALCIITPLIMNIVYTEQGPLADLRDPDLREDIILLLGMGAVYGVIQALVAYFVGPELPTIVAGGCTLLFIILYERYIVKRSEETKKKADDAPRYGIWARPYLYALSLMIVLLLVTRLVSPVKDFLIADYLTWEVGFSSISATKVMKFSPFYSPGTILVITTLSVPLFVKLTSRYFPEDRMEASFLKDLGPGEMEDIEKIRESERTREETSLIEKVNTPKKKESKLTGEMKEAVKRMKETSEKEEKKGSDGKKRSPKKGKVGKKKESGDESKKAEKRKRMPALDAGDDDEVESQPAAAPRRKKKKKKIDPGEGKQNEKELYKEPDKDNGKKKIEKKSSTKKKRRKRGAEIINDGGDFEVVFEDDDDYEEDDEDDEDFDAEESDEFEVFFDDDDDDGVDDDFIVDFEDDEGTDDDDVPQITARELATGMRTGKMLQGALKNTLKDVIPILFAIVSFVALANIMRYFDMTYSIASTLVDLVGGAYVFFIPLIGMSGSALTGSTTTSNVLFGGLHMEAAQRLGLPAVRTAAAQVLGSSAGEMISPMNAVVIATAIGMKNKESVLIKRLIPTFVFWLILCTVISFVFISF